MNPSLIIIPVLAILALFVALFLITWLLTDPVTGE